MTPPDDHCPAITRVDSDARDLAVAIAKLSVTIEHLDGRVDRVDKTLEGFGEFTRKFDGIIAQMVRVEGLITSAQAQTAQATERMELLEERIETLERNHAAVKTALRWMAGVIAVIATQFSDQLLALVIGSKKP